MPSPPSPELLQILRILDGDRAKAALTSALELHLFEHLEERPATVAELASRAGIAPRGAAALLDYLVGLGLVTVAGGQYRNSPSASAHLVPGRPTYVGDGHADLMRANLGQLARLTEIARSGDPGRDIDSPEVLEFWTVLTPFIARMGRPVADEAVRMLRLTEGAPSLLDVGGGMALYSLALLEVNPRARATQSDWPHINRAARERVEAAGHGARFDTLDGDFRLADYGEARFDVAVLSNIMHQESPASNHALLGKLHRALKPGGQLVVSEFVVDDGRTGPPPSLFFHLNMLIHTHGGKAYERSELTRMFREAGFAEPSFTPVGPASTLIVATRA